MDTVILDAGEVEYSEEKAACDIDALIAALQEAKGEGATHVVLASGNHRGARWLNLEPGWEWA